jgi:poly(A) polymerase
VATDAPPEDVQRLFEKTIPVGVSFGVVIVLDRGIKVEVATFRSDGTYEDGRHPESVTFCGAEGDAARRDFTINAMFYDPVTEEVTDLFGGRKDIRRKLIRTVGRPEERFREDRLRMLRAVRLAAVLGFSIDPDTAKAVRNLAGQISSVSGERIRDELEKLLASPARAAGIELLDGLSLLERILPEISALKGVEQSSQLHPEGDVYRHTLLALEEMEGSDFVTAMSVLLHDIGKPTALSKLGKFYGHESDGAEAAREVCDRLRISRADTDAICWAIVKHMVFKDARRMRESTLRRLLGHDSFPILLELHRADTVACRGDLSNCEFVRSKLAQYSEEPILPPPLLSGSDLLDMGLEEGPRIGELLEKARDAQLEGAIRNREEALEFVRRSMKNLT